MDIICSQPVDETINLIEDVKRDLEAKVQSLKEDITNKEIQNEVTELLENLESMEMTVGNLRITKVGKLLTRYEKDLPENISNYAKKINDKWKSMLSAYRESIKQKMQKKVSDIRLCNANFVTHQFFLMLTLPAPCILESSSKIFIFTFLCGASKGFMKAFKAFIKPFETPQTSAKIKILVNFFSSSEIGAGRVKVNVKRYSQEIFAWS